MDLYIKHAFAYLLSFRDSLIIKIDQQTYNYQSMSEEWFIKAQKTQPTVKIPLQFSFQPVEILSKQLTKLNSPSPYRILYLGPRWDDSAALHKKYANKGGYQFNDKQINKNNNFFSETMCQNQFYKNQVYYRAFEGMNPTIDKQHQLHFNSRFQSGNLDCVVKVAPDEYDLFLRIDSNTQGQLFWFYFEISNGKPDSIVKFNICNITKSIQLYEKGFKPYSSPVNSDGLFQNWTQDQCHDVSVGIKRLRYEFIYEKIKIRKLYQLSFKYKFQSASPVRFAYCIPYTYSQMLAQINQLHSSNPEVTRIGSIGRSLTGLQLPFLMLGKQQDKNIQKLVLVCIGRLHPGQSNGSHVLSGLMNYLCKSNQAQYIRKKVITIFVPMLNPDGVVLGNSRTSAIGKDLNRQFKARSRFLFPEIHSLKQFCNLVSETHDIQMFLDFHGHSRKKNMFVFGPNYNITQPQYYRSRVLPRFFSQITPIFRYFGCDYTIPPSKSTTARAVMLQQLNIPYVYAIQTSIGQYFDYQNHRIIPFNKKKWNELGSQSGRAVKQYFQSIEQFSDYLKTKTNNDEVSSINKNGNKTPKIPPIKLPGSPQKSKKPPKTKEVKLMKIFQQIKNAQEQRKVLKKKAEQSDNPSSDSQDEQDNLQGKKRVQFEGMVKQCIETEKKRQQRVYQLEENKFLKLKKEQISNIPRRKQKFFQREQMNMMKQFMRNSTIGATNLNNETERYDTSKTNRVQQKRFNKSEQCSNKYSQQKNSTIFIEDPHKEIIKYDEMINQHAFFDDVLPEQTAQKTRKNNLNLRMFNFSKMMENFETRNIMTSGQRGKNRYNGSNTLDTDIQSKQESTQITNYIYTYNKSPIEESTKRQQVDSSPERQLNNNVSSRKIKGLYPASFYRIKYQSFKKKQQKNNDELKQQNKLVQEQYKNIETQKRKQGLFLSIKRVNKC